MRGVFLLGGICLSAKWQKNVQVGQSLWLAKTGPKTHPVFQWTKSTSSQTAALGGFCSSPRFIQPASLNSPSLNITPKDQLTLDLCLPRVPLKKRPHYIYIYIKRKRTTTASEEPGAIGAVGALPSLGPWTLPRRDGAVTSAELHAALRQWHLVHSRLHATERLRHRGVLFFSFFFFSP